MEQDEPQHLQKHTLRRFVRTFLQIYAVRAPWQVGETMWKKYLGKIMV